MKLRTASCFLTHHLFACSNGSSKGATATALSSLAYYSHPAIHTLTTTTTSVHNQSHNMVQTRASSRQGRQQGGSSTAVMSAKSNKKGSMTTKKITAAKKAKKGSKQSFSNSISDKTKQQMKISKETAASNKKSNTVKNENQTDDGPWYRIFTKGDEEYDTYMATEWGFEKRGDRNLFEKLCLEGAQSGLSWLTILRKRQAYRRVFYNFDIDKVASMTSEDVDSIIQQNDKDIDDPKRNLVVRHRGKIEATISNAQCIVKMKQEYNSKNNNGDDDNNNVFDSFLWGFVNDQPILNDWNGNLSNALSKSKESEEMSKALKKLGFRFVGPTTCYSLMQSVGMVIDHPVNSPEWKAAHERLQNRPGGYQKGS